MKLSTHILRDKSNKGHRIFLLKYMFKKYLLDVNKYNINISPHSRVGSRERENLVLRHYVPHFQPNSGGIACRVVERNASLCLDKYFISSSGNQTHNQTLLQSFVWTWLNNFIVTKKKINFNVFLHCKDMFVYLSW